jgi:hypothetical protein
MAWAYVQGAIVDNVTTIALPSVTPATGNLMVVVGFVGNVSQALTISDTQANTWTPFTNNVANDGHGDECKGWWAVSKNAVATVVTVGGNAGSLGAAAYAEYSGNDTVAPADGDNSVAGVTGGTGTDGVTTASITTVADGDLIVACLADASRSAAPANPGTGFTSRAASTNASPALFGFRWEDKVQASHGAITPTYTDAVNGADAWTGEVAAFKAASGGGPGQDPSLQHGGSRTIFQLSQTRWG